MRRSDVDRNTADIEAAVEGCNQINPWWRETSTQVSCLKYSGEERRKFLGQLDRGRQSPPGG